MGDVGERAAVHERRVVLQRLHEIGFEGVLEQHRHGAVRLEVAGAHRLLVTRVRNDDVAQPLLEILQRRRQAENRHDLGGDDDVEAVLAGIAVARAAEGIDDLAQGAVVHVHDALPLDAAHVDVEFVAVVNMVVEERREQVIGQRDRREVTREVEVDVLHRHDLRMAAARRPALHPEHGAEAWLAQANHRFLADAVERVPKPVGGRSLALAGGRGADGGDENQLAVGAGLHALDELEQRASSAL